MVVTRAAIPIPGVPGGARVPLPAGNYVSIMVWLGRGRQPGWGGALVFSRQGCPRTDLDEPN